MINHLMIIFHKMLFTFYLSFVIIQYYGTNIYSEEIRERVLPQLCFNAYETCILIGHLQKVINPQDVKEGHKFDNFKISGYISSMITINHSGDIFILYNSRSNVKIMNLFKSEKIEVIIFPFHINYIIQLFDRAVSLPLKYALFMLSSHLMSEIDDKELKKQQF